ncbi:hypothetical protein [Streptomyces sp. NPDC101776]
MARSTLKRPLRYRLTLAFAGLSALTLGILICIPSILENLA